MTFLTLSATLNPAAAPLLEQMQGITTSVTAIKANFLVRSL